MLSIFAPADHGTTIQLNIIITDYQGTLRLGHLVENGYILLVATQVFLERALSWQGQLPNRYGL